jgi:hypothetical protein
MPFVKRWLPDQVPGFPPGAGPAVGRGEWVDVYVESTEEREASIRSAAAEKQRIEAESRWIATEASAAEVLTAVSPIQPARLFPAASLREAWVRLAGGGQLPPGEHLLHRAQRTRRLTLRGFVETDEVEGEGVRAWAAPHGESGVIQNHYLDAQGGLYRPRRAASLVSESFLLAVHSGGSGRGVAVEVFGDESMEAVHHWSGAVWPAPYVEAVCSALRMGLRGR